MQHYNFEELYKTQTMLDEGFLTSEAGFDLDGLQPKEKEIIFKNYYLDICLAVYQLHFKRYTSEQIEKLLDTDEKKYLFLMAQAKQLLFDKSSGRTSMLRGEDEKLSLCLDTKNILDRLGFIRNRTFFR